MFRKILGIFSLFLSLYACLLVQAQIYVAHSQPLSVRMSDVNFHGLPRISLKACVTRNGEIVRGLDSSNFQLYENTIRQELKIRCPDASEINSVVLVLDNSGSIFPVLPKLIEAAGRLIDSLGANDECAIVSFGRDIIIQQDFTTDKALLKKALLALNANGGTPLYDASYLAVQMLNSRSNNRHAVIITDGEDNLSSKTADSVTQLAITNSVKLYTIAFNIDQRNQKIMEAMAIETGGSFFIVERPSELNAVYEQIAAQITEKCCVAEYVSTSCSDSIRNLAINVTSGGAIATDIQSFPSPSRSDTIEFVIEVPDELNPFSSGMGYITMNPPPSPLLELNLRFVLTYDENIVDVLPPLPFTLGTISQNQLVLMVRINPGEMEFRFNKIKPAITTGRLIGFPLQALVTDSSRKVPFGIKEIILEGCPAEFIIRQDTTLVCQCFQSLNARLDPPAVVKSPGIVTIPLIISGGLQSGLGMHLSVDFLLPEEWELLDILDGALFPEGSLIWMRLPGGGIRIKTSSLIAPLDSAGIVAVAEVRANLITEPRERSLTITSAEMWQRCCLEKGTLPSVTVLQDGICEPVVRKREQPSIRNLPNPFSNVQHPLVSVYVNIPETVSGRHFTLVIMDTQGKILQKLIERELSAGVHVVHFDATALPSGRYTAMLMSEDLVVTHSMINIR